jgi:hypothetical protein
MTIMPVPETTMREQNRASFWKHKIRLSRQGFIMQPESKSASVQAASQYQFGFCIDAAYARHHATAHVWRHDVSQGRRSGRRAPDDKPVLSI